MDPWIIAATSAAAIAAVNWYFFLAPKSSATAHDAPDGTQLVTIAVEGGYAPSEIRVRRGAPVRLVFDRKEKSPCSEELVIGALGVRRFLKPFEKTAVEFTPLESGSFDFTCGMNMLRGRIVVEG
ncbi:MAG: cupredoxin domain-containing protein [Bryobacterales bacterium]|nr:cupredoxin domain-containing protein [Bryobacterales bacterium]